MVDWRFLVFLVLISLSLSLSGLVLVFLSSWTLLPPNGSNPDANETAWQWTIVVWKDGAGFFRTADFGGAVAYIEEYQHIVCRE